jgi:hypothetical protein
LGFSVVIYGYRHLLHLGLELMNTTEEVQSRIYNILATAGRNILYGCVEHRVSNDKMDEAIIRNLVNRKLIRREFDSVGKGFGFRLVITPAGRSYKRRLKKQF